MEKSEESKKTTCNLVLSGPWDKSYWFARSLINSDQYGALARKKKIIAKIINQLDAIICQKNLTDDDKYNVCKTKLLEEIRLSAKPGSQMEQMAINFVGYLENEINSLEDIIIFNITVRYLIIPINDALECVPSSDKEFCYTTAKSILDSVGEENVAKVLSIWDNLGTKGCLAAERTEVVHEFTKLRNNLKSLSLERSDLEDNMFLTAFVQEFERRLGQKRKTRAGNSLEDVATFLFDYYNFESHPKPDHFQSDIEIDKWFKCADGWLIGISCKRTLRERWKQVSSGDAGTLSGHKIKEIWHLTTYDKDLSDDKITMLGKQRHIFYLADESEKYRLASSHKGMKDYVRPLSRLVPDIREQQKNK